MTFLPNECIHTPHRASSSGGTDSSAATNDRGSTSPPWTFLLSLETNAGSVVQEFPVLTCCIADMRGVSILRVGNVFGKRR
eukprot:CAMPEP_0204151250 /NCGR_PEP_ID=MMETSP0361-20130328/25986_1 /ASSEMBLY_ACC=CAM_ASM_000343 /TAXON_ID=268821 /ORGANISM="Scrippsiella Hangoei, Strain SHTV-5" /LENGTH=80 /DNA_ID=CAMNT_0051106049 /DNA_START=467 /DNA_END=705 /DNA_ORIENTATION=+